ncbi:regulatory protein RecX [Cohnella pontilimi]|uniref:Regulatory protein RecX n=1 Tax=Cohnella pontilimi TaxID=2564100 RepID=A0A4U0FDV5_9BACL|nr:regulatory protein RecX [Cohnella pontilimi]TJY43116.1 regulatory protein RecX [Cohnella pontilimi]
MANLTGSGAGGRRSGYRKSEAGKKGGQRQAGAGRVSADRQTNPTDGSHFIKVVTEAEVVAVEAHPKHPAMYRVAIRLFGESLDDTEIVQTESSSGNTDDVPGDWNAEVDALIAGAAGAASAGSAETVITVHEDTLVSLRLLKGRRISAEEWEALRHEEEREDAYRSALAILERKARTSRELSEALKRKGYSPDIINSCLERLRERRMLDDSSYAKRFAEQRVTGQRKGSRLIRQELLQRGITKADAELALGELDEHAEREAAFALARKKWPQLKGELRERKHKLTAFLLRRGYPNGIVKQALDHASTGASQSGDPDFDEALEFEGMDDGNPGWDGTDPNEFG